MNTRLHLLYKDLWLTYLTFILCAFFISRTAFNFSNYSVLELFTSLYYEKRAMGIYVLGYLIFLGPLCREMLNYICILKLETHNALIAVILKKFLVRAISYSFILNIGCYIILGTITNDYALSSNIFRILLQFFAQIVGWIFVSSLYLFLHLIFNKMMVAISISYLSLIFLCLSNYVNCYKDLAYYIRLYYLMFHIEQYPNWSIFFSVLFFYAMMSLVFISISYNQLVKKEYY